MSIRAVFRVQCDGPCGGWLSQTGELIRLTPPSRDTGLWPGERAARIAARNAGWYVDRNGVVHCPKCQENPLGIVLPGDPICVCTHGLTAHNLSGLCVALPGVLGCGCLGFQESDPECCAAVTPSGLIRCARKEGHSEEHRNGTLDWF